MSRVVGYIGDVHVRLISNTELNIQSFGVNSPCDPFIPPLATCILTSTPQAVKPYDATEDLDMPFCTRPGYIAYYQNRNDPYVVRQAFPDVVTDC